MDVIILGGSKDNLFTEEGVENKTLLKVGSQTIIERIFTALKGVNFNKVILTGDSTLPMDVRNLADLFVTGNEIWQKIDEVMKVSDAETFMLISGDIPLLSKAMMEEAISLYGKQNNDALFFVVSKDLVVKKYPNFKKSYFFLNGEECKIGNLFFFNRHSYAVMNRMVIPLIQTRKASLPIAYLKFAGLSITLKYFLKTVSIKEVEDRIKYLTNLNLRVLFFQYPEIALDVDRKKDLVAIREILNFSKNC